MRKAEGIKMDARSSRYHEVYAHWQRNPEVFWAEAAADIHWFEKPKKIFDKDAGILWPLVQRGHLQHLLQRARSSCARRPQ
jgi:hypothetical protein